MTLASPFWELGRELREMRCLYDLPQTRFPVIARLGPAAGMVGDGVRHVRNDVVCDVSYAGLVMLGDGLGLVMCLAMCLAWRCAWLGVAMCWAWRGDVLGWAWLGDVLGLGWSGDVRGLERRWRDEDVAG